MPNVVTHPSVQELTAFGQGKLSEAASTTIADQLERCPACRQVLETLPGDSFVDKVRAARPGASSLPGRAGANAARAAASSSLPPLDLPPELASYAKYRFLRELGRGGMGVVYQAEQTVMGRTVAIKIISSSVLDHPDALPRFQGEVQAAAKLNHDNIVRAHDAEQVGSLHLLVMEYVEGISLAELVAKKGPLPIAHACHYIRQAALGLQHAFEQGMVHRDVKPHNLMVTARGQVKVLDFGLARMRSERSQGGGLTQAGAFMGTPEYVAPEQATDARAADTRADIYSLGCTLFFVLTGQPPFQGGTAIQLILAHLEQEPPALWDVRAEVPRPLAAVVARMLAKDPGQRFQTPIEVAQELAAFVKSGAKRAAEGAASPGTGTALAADTNKIKAILRDVPGKAPARAAQVEAAGPFASLEEGVGAARTKAQPVRQRRWIGGSVLVGLLLLGLLGMWAGGVFKVKTRDGTIVLENLPADAEVIVDGETVTITPAAGKAATIRVAAGKKHQLQVKKEGFKVFGSEVEIDVGQRRPIQVHLETAAPPVQKPEGKGDDRRPGTTAVDRRAISCVGQWRVEGDELAQEATDQRLTALTFGDPTWTDYEFSAEVKRTGGQGHCLLIYRVTDSNNLNDYGIVPRTPTLHHLRVKVNGIHDTRQEKRSPQVDTDEWHTVSVIVRGPQIRCYCNGKEVMREEDPRNPRGRVGFVLMRSAFRFRKILVKDAQGKDLFRGPPKLPEYVPLFNGKNLTGWKTHPAQPGNWRVENGILIGSGAVSHLYTERADYRNFHLRVEARIDDVGSSGVISRAPFGPKHPANNPTWLLGYGVLINSSQRSVNKTGSLYVGTEEAVVSIRDAPVPPDKWFTMEVLADGNHLVVKVDGKWLVDYIDEERRFTSGHIALGLYNPLAVAEFRKIEVVELPATNP